MIIDSSQFQQKTYKCLLPKPKTHLFMKRFTRIQAIDRQMRKNWIKMKRQKDRKQFQISQDSFSPIKIDRQHHTTNQTNQQLMKLKMQLDSKKRLKILSNHKKNQQIFYGKHKNKQMRCKSQYVDEDKLFKQAANQYSSYVNTLNSSSNQQNCPKLKYTKSCSSELQKSRLINREKIITLQGIKNQWNGHLILRKRLKTKQKQLQIMKFQSFKEIQRINKKNQSKDKKRLDLQKSLLKKMQRSKIYYDLIKPINLKEYEN